eukprot:g226.t1
MPSSNGGSSTGDVLKVSPVMGKKASTLPASRAARISGRSAGGVAPSGDEELEAAGRSRSNADNSHTGSLEGRREHGEPLDAHGAAGARRVWRGAPGAAVGLQAGMHIVKVGKEVYSFAALYEDIKKAQELDQTYEITVVVPSNAEERAAWVLYCMSMPAGLLGGLLTLSLPWLAYKTMSKGLDLNSKAFTWPVLFAFVGCAIGHCLGRAGRVLLEWSFVTYGGKMLQVGEVIVVLGVCWGCFAVCGNSLLSTPLSKAMCAMSRRMQMVALVPLCMFSLCRIADGLLMMDRPTSFDFVDVLPLQLGLAEVQIDAQYLMLTLLASRICIAAYQRMIEVAAVLPVPDSAPFRDSVHKPCAKLLQEIPPNLSPFGLPAMLMSSAGILSITIIAYNRVVQMLSYSAEFWWLNNWIRLLGHACWFTSISLSVASPLSILSSALEELESGLNEQRQQDPSRHLEVEAVEAMLAKVNHGQGWGIPVVKGLVLNKTMIQALLLRIVVAATVIKAFLDRQLGFQKDWIHAGARHHDPGWGQIVQTQEEKDDFSAELDVIANQAVTNITNFISNQTLGNLTALTAEILKNRNFTA